MGAVASAPTEPGCPVVGWLGAVVREAIRGSERNHVTDKEHFYDAIVIGAGLTGMYQVYKLREMGFSVKGYEAGAGVGGTWYWNRYPGCRLDTESYTYGYFCLIGITPDWKWSEQFAGQPELLRYANYAADRMDIRGAYQFNTKVIAARYRDDQSIWDVELHDGSRASCRYLITAVGLLSATRIPEIKGIDSFKGELFHTSMWPRDEEGNEPARRDFSGKKVGVIGTGATGVQVVPEIAKTAKDVFVFQRTPNWCTPLGNQPISDERMQYLQDNYDNILAYIKTTDAAFPYHRYPKRAVDASEEERRRFFEELYDMPGYGIWLGNYKDVLLDKQANRYLADFVAEKIRKRVRDPATAEKLIPKNHPFGARRVPMETGYYETFNQENVHLVDVSEESISHITESGVETVAAHYELDALIFATGFDAITGPLDRIDIRGRGGVRLRDVWADGPVTYLGLQTAGFPNLFMLVGAQSGAAFCNIGVCGALQVEWLSKMLRDMRNRGFVASEPSEAAQKRWGDDIYREFQRTLMAEGDAWWVKVVKNPDGSITRRALTYLSGGQQYRMICDRVAYQDYDGFVLS